MKALIALDGPEPALRAVDWVVQSGFSHATVLAVRPRTEVLEGRRRRGRRFSDRPGWASPGELEKAVEQLQLAGVSHVFAGQIVRCRQDDRGDRRKRRFRPDRDRLAQPPRLPVPGGIGVAEFGLEVGLTSPGMNASAASATVLMYRLATFYLPPTWGFFAFRWLQRNKYL